MKKFSSRELRSLFLDFFKEKGHEIVPSSSLVPADDPTLLFTNAGMVQFKKVFLGEEKRPYTRAASCQKCVRAGGKHNDLENVGYTARHHTFFEMLGNFSFGDYFKKEAIEYAWELLTKRIGLPVDKLWVTVFREDDEAAALWPKITGISPERVLRLDEDDNFWAMGDTGPCGPCSEILIDQGEEMACGPDCGIGKCDCDRYLELWNLVFMQFFRDESGKLNPLPKPSIDTGMGLERITAICQGVKTNFDTDLFSGLFRKLEELSGKKYGTSEEIDVAMRVIGDHARASAFLIADGVVPSNEGRGYVLRRIIRRAVRYGRVLGLEEPFLGTIANVVVDEMGDIYPELEQSRDFISKVLEHEEKRFFETLGTGLAMLEEELGRLKQEGKKLIPGKFIFTLYDTYGFPVDIVRDIAKERGFQIDREGFNKALEEQRQRSKSKAKAVVTEELPEIYRQLLEQGRGGTFVGYHTLSTKSKILALFDGKNALEKVEKGWKGELIVEETPFYAESGGQVGDQGEIKAPSGRAKVLNTIKRGDLIVHQIEVLEGELLLNQEVELSVYEGPRMDTARNHTATHLLHAALKQVLGDHVKQAGSLVGPDRLRFDFTHFSAVSLEELQQVEDIVNEQVRADQEVHTEVLAYQEALERGAVALFGEKYGEKVRVVAIPGFSMELCGGTHLPRTGMIGLFKIVHESSVSSGIRRIEAVTGKAAVEEVHKMENLIHETANAIKSPVPELSQKAAKLLAQIKELEKELEKARMGKAGADPASLAAQAVSVKDVKLVSAQVDLGDPKALRTLGDRIRDNLGSSGVVVLGTKNKNKALLLVMVTKDLTKRVKAGDMVSKLAKMVGGGGGGRPDMAQAGGPNAEALPEAINAAPKILEEMIS